MCSPFAWLRGVQHRRQLKADEALWRHGYDFAAGYLLREGQPAVIERLINLEDALPAAKRVSGMRCAVHDYRAALACASTHQHNADH